MSIWIIVIVVIMLIGSVSWAMPSPRDKILAALRRQALKSGLTVRLIDQKLADSLFAWLDNYHGYVLYEKHFSLSRKLNNNTHKVRVIRLSEDPNAHEMDEHDRLRAFILNSDLLLDLPSSVEAMTLSPNSMGLLWKEQNLVEDVIKIEQCLTACIEEDDFFV